MRAWWDDPLNYTLMLARFETRKRRALKAVSKKSEYMRFYMRIRRWELRNQ
jgi:hypothetical protein